MIFEARRSIETGYRKELYGYRLPLTRLTRSPGTRLRVSQAGNRVDDPYAYACRLRVKRKCDKVSR
jgi:hypothetical protein